jgi:hypothetical protein
MDPEFCVLILHVTSTSKKRSVTLETTVLSLPAVEESARDVRVIVNACPEDP